MIAVLSPGAGWTPQDIVTLIVAVTALLGTVVAIIKALKSAPSQLPNGTPTTQAIEQNLQASGQHSGQIAAIQAQLSDLNNGPKTPQ